MQELEQIVQGPFCLFDTFCDACLNRKAMQKRSEEAYAKQKQKLFVFVGDPNKVA